ncbi:MAG TPA: hypothetical protein VH684_10800 [Xanthobacteraceae bacterium]|jgi:outer membrane murein-binding lipoprotein Lpp
MDDCNESERQSGANAAQAATVPATVIDQPSVQSKTPEIELIEVPAPRIAENDSLAGANNGDRVTLAGLGALVPKTALEPVLSIKSSEIEQLKADAPTAEAAESSSAMAGEPKLDRIKPRMQDSGSSGPCEPIAAGAAISPNGEPRPRKNAARAAALIAAAGLGALAGVVGAFAVGLSAPAPAPAQVPVAYSKDAADTQSLAADTHSLKATVAQLRADVSALKTSIESANKAANGQFAKMTERFDRIERAQAEPAARIGKAVDALERLQRRADNGVSKETTGSVPTGPATAPAAVPAPPAAASAAASPPAPAPIPGWAVRDVYRGVALIQSPRFGLIEVEAGDVIPGIGRVEAIRKQDGHWVVATSRGIIASR